MMEYFVSFISDLSSGGSICTNMLIDASAVLGLIELLRSPSVD
jgi:hypothetical protein